MSVFLKPRKSTTPGVVPTTANLADGEMAVNTADKKIYIRIGAAIIEIAKYFSGAWADISGKPTTLSGYGITDAPTLTGVGASGTWGISITGSAATATNATQLNGQAASYYLNASNLNAGTISDSRLPNTMANKNLTGTTVSEFLVQGLHGKPRSNLGSPTITEMALFELQFDNKLWFYPDNLLTFESTADGVNWTTETVTQNQVQRLVAGKGSVGGASVQIPRTAQQYRITITNRNSYVYLNALYAYFSTNGNTCAFEIWKKRNDGEWIQHTSDPTQVGSWPGHLYLPFSTIPWSQAATTGHYNDVRIVITPVWNVSNSNPITLYGLQLWGGYPAGKRTIYDWDEFQNVTFPAGVHAATAPLNTNSTQLATTAYVLAAIADDAPTKTGSGASGTWGISITGNADTATKLQTARTINGTAFDGSANITTATWGTARTLSYTGDVTGSASVNGSSNVSFAMTLAASGVTAGTYRSVTVDAKGRVTAGTNPTTLAGYGITDAVGTTGDQSIAGNKTFTGTLADSVGHVRDLAINTQNATYTLVLADRGKCIVKTDTGAYTWTIPPNSSVAYPVGTMITLRNANATGAVTIARGSGVALRKAGSGTNANATLAVWGMATLLKEGTDSWVISGTGVS